MQEIEFSKIFSCFSFNPESPMQFGTGFFLVFFTIVIFLYSYLKKYIKLRNIYLMLVSFYMYYKSSGLFVILLLCVCIINYLVGRLISVNVQPRRKKQWITLGLIANLGVLAYYKYTNFFVGSIMEIFHHPFEGFDIVLPVGISFFTFQSMSYIIDIYRGNIRPLSKFTDFAFFVSFFPQLVAGPIVRASEFIPQITKPTIVTKQMFGRGLFLIVGGLFKKMVISDFISLNFVDRVFDSPALFSGLENLMGVYGYALQIYCDFSGYSDIAIGLALLMGFHFNINFDSPYQSQSITEFWRRWHISLSSWLRDYLYIPLGGNRKGPFRTDVNLLLTMLLGGLWHGASVLFLLWGAWHGVLLILDKWRIRYLNPPIRIGWLNNMRRLIMTFLTFNLVCIGWVFFRAGTLDTAVSVFTQIITSFHPEIFPSFVEGYRSVFLIIVLGYVLHFIPKRQEEFTFRMLNRLSFRWKIALFVIFVLLIVQVRSSELLPFIYFQF